MAKKHPEVAFFKVMEDEARDIIDEQRITGFPTFHFFLKQSKIDEMSGANPQALEAKIVEHKAKGAAPAFGGSGVSLGGGAVARSAEDVARARLKAMSGGASTVAASKPAAAPAPAPAAVSPAKPIPAPAPAPASAPVHAPAAADHSTDASRALQEAAKARARAGASKPAGFTPNAEHLAMLVDMGISRERGHRALQAINNSSIDAALDWLAAHQDDAGLDDPLPAATTSITVVDDDGDISMTGAGGAGVAGT
jgi:thiol-disulfide isomerase/thioredoxin